MNQEEYVTLRSLQADLERLNSLLGTPHPTPADLRQCRDLGPRIHRTLRQLLARTQPNEPLTRWQ